eukprot:TRINITY_DN8224_c0_g1_i4.p3 TRINITY_DN8224_c0_g1~~TRINITY_DN8224_c0_g1_i4.p3  ORF type:complete len:153 (+),score=3.36 TRINITY_DN8224_c0_g1_i4:223-681(+)
MQRHPIPSPKFPFPPITPFCNHPRTSTTKNVLTITYVANTFKVILLESENNLKTITHSKLTTQKLQNQPTHLIIAQTNFRVSKTNLKFTPKHKKSKKKKLHKNLPKFFPKLRQSNYYNKNVPKQCMQTEDTPEKKTITLKTLKRSLFSRQTK